jgi:carbohydrate kinase (thermoresistant glucokinase family)
MGVTGSGKTTVGGLLARRLGVPFYDADDFHPEANVKKMAAGIPLTDEDRLPWLLRLSGEMPAWERAGGAVLACSALRQSYREILEGGGRDVRFIYLRAPQSLIAERVHGRRGHFMPETLVASQFATLEEPREALAVDVDRSPEEIVEAILGLLPSAE